MPHNPPPTFGSGQFFVPATMGGNGLTLSNANLTATHDGGSSNSFRGAYLSDRNGSRTPVVDDRRYFEMLVSGAADVGAGVGFGGYGNILIGTVNPYGVAGFYLGSGINHGGVNPGVITNGTELDNSSYANFNLGFVIGVAVNGTNGECFFSINGVWIGDPDTDTAPAFTLPTADVAPFVTLYSDTTRTAIALTARLAADHEYPLPVGYKPWNQLTP